MLGVGWKLRMVKAIYASAQSDKKFHNFAHFLIFFFFFFFFFFFWGGGGGGGGMGGHLVVLIHNV